LAFELGWNGQLAGTERAEGGKFEGNRQAVIVAVY
jgi:hypothetical protein